MAEQNRVSASTVPPYVAYSTFLKFLDTLRDGMPGRIDRSLMANLSGAVQAQIFATLPYLGLMSEQRSVTDRLTRLVHLEGAERQAVIRDMLTDSYPFLFGNGFDLRTATLHQFEEQFKSLGIRGDTIRKAQAFFLAAARDAELPLSRFLANRAPRRSVQKAQRPRASTPTRASQKSAQPATPSSAGPQQGLTWEQTLLAKFPSFDPNWSAEVQARWFDAFDRLMQRGNAQRADPEDVQPQSLSSGATD